MKPAPSGAGFFMGIRQRPAIGAAKAGVAVKGRVRAPQNRRKPAGSRLLSYFLRVASRLPRGRFVTVLVRPPGTGRRRLSRHRKMAVTDLEIGIHVSGRENRP